MKIIKVPRKVFRKKYPETAGFHYTTEEGEHIIEAPIGIGTKSLMHEIAHARLGHESVPMTVDEWAQRELAADSWVYEKLGTEPSWNEILCDFIPIMEQGFEAGYSQNDLFNFIKDAISDAGYIVEDKEKSIIWDSVKEVHRSLKQKGKGGL